MQRTRSYHEGRLSQLQTLRTPWEDTWRDIDELIVPNFLRLNPSESGRHENQGELRHLASDVVDTTALLAHKEFQSGLQSGMTSKARPWFKLTTYDKERRDVPGVRKFLDDATIRMREVMDKSNIYNTFHVKYGALGSIGTAVSYITPDPKYIVRNNYVIAGHYWIAEDHMGRVDTLYHVIPMTAQKIIGHFQRPDDRIPDTVQKAYDRGERDLQFLVYHAMEPRTHRDMASDRPQDMPWLSNYWMREDDSEHLLRESGSEINRIVASRWDVVPGDPYGYSLGMQALADVKQLQLMVSRMLAVIDKTSNPPLVAPGALRGKRLSLLPGGTTYNDDVAGGQKVEPIINYTSYNITPLSDSIYEVQERIKRTFHNDLFSAISSMPGVQPRNELEVFERKEERLLQLGPALERLDAEELQKTVGTIYHYMKKAGILPDLPDDEEGREIESDFTVEYTSIMGQAQKAVGVQPIERLLTFAGTLVETDPTIMDKIDLDEVIDDYGTRIGAPAAIVRSDEDVMKIRQQRQEMEQAAQAAEMAAQMAPAMNQAADAMGKVGDMRGTGTSTDDLLGSLGYGDRRLPMERTVGASR